MQCSSSQPLALCLPVNAIKKSLPSKKKERKKERKKEKPKQITISFSNFYQTAPSRGQLQQHQPAGEGAGDGDTALSPAQKTLPYPSYSHRNTLQKRFSCLCANCCQGEQRTWPWPVAHHHSSCVCALTKFTLSLVVTSYLAREIF